MKQTINDWEPEVKSLLETLYNHGVGIIRGDNGEDAFNFDGDLPKFIENLIACDEARLYVNVEGKTHWLYLVLGNEPGVIASDYSVCPALDAATDEHYEAWSGRRQPTKQVER